MQLVSAPSPPSRSRHACEQTEEEKTAKSRVSKKQGPRKLFGVSKGGRKGRGRFVRGGDVRNSRKVSSCSRSVHSTSRGRGEGSPPHTHTHTAEPRVGSKKRVEAGDVWMWVWVWRGGGGVAEGRAGTRREQNVKKRRIVHPPEKDIPTKSTATGDDGGGGKACRKNPSQV